MPNTGNFWKPQEKARLVEAYQQKQPWVSDRDWATRIGEELDRTEDSVRGQLDRIRRDGGIPNRIQQSVYPVYDEPLTMEGDAVCIGDVEAPYHHGEFMSRVFDLADKWHIDQINIVGDFLHLDCLSSFSKNWTAPRKGGMTESAAMDLETFARGLPAKQREKMLETIDRIGVREQEDGLSSELDEARKIVRRIDQQFKLVHMSLGNHEGRIITKFDVRMQADEISKWLDAPTWKIAPYYFCNLTSAGQEYQLEHPRNYSKGSSRALCAKYQRSVIMFHGHHYYKSMDISGHFLALEPGCCVDESRLAYAAQRHRTGDAHVLGAVIVRDGVAWDVGLEAQRTDWKALARL